MMPNWEEQVAADLRRKADTGAARHAREEAQGSVVPRSTAEEKTVRLPNTPQLPAPPAYPVPPARPELPPMQPQPRQPPSAPPSDGARPVRPQPHRWRSGLSRGLVAAAGLHTTRDVREYVELHRQLTAAVTSGRRIAVLAIEPAQGCTTVAALLATALATRRLDPVLLVDAAAGSFHPPLHHMFNARPVRTIGDLARRPPRITERSDFEGQLTPVGKDVWLVPADEVARTHGHHAPDADTYIAAVRPFIRYFDITVTDLSSAPGSGTAELLLDRVHALCLVTSATRSGFDGVTSRLRELRDHTGSPWAGRTVVVANHTEESAGSTHRLQQRLRHRGQGVPIVQLGFDPELWPGFPSRPSHLSPATHLTAMRLAADVLGTAMPGAAAPTVPPAEARP